MTITEMIEKCSRVKCGALQIEFTISRKESQCRIRMVARDPTVNDGKTMYQDLHINLYMCRMSTDLDDAGTCLEISLDEFLSHLETET